jgi:hypothetical protein
MDGTLHWELVAALARQLSVLPLHSETVSHMPT